MVWKRKKNKLLTSYDDFDDIDDVYDFDNFNDFDEICNEIYDINV